MKTVRTILVIVGAGIALLVFVLFVLGSSSHHSLTIDILGSYFPAWMVCILSGLALTLVAHWIVQLGKLEAYIGPGPLIYPCLMLIFTFTTWILFYEN
jgi:hypothetical protein